MPKRLTKAFFRRSVHEVAPDLIGATLLFNGVGGRLVEVEAYHHTDPAAHSFHGPTARNAVMFGPTDVRLLCAGPGRVCEALGITAAHNGLALDEPPFALFARTGEVEVIAGPRIGITKAAEKPWRYGLKGSVFLSKPFRPNH